MAPQPHQRIQHSGTTITLAVRKDPITDKWYSDVEDIQDHFPGVNKFVIDGVTLVFLKDKTGQRYNPDRLEHYPDAVITALIKDAPLVSALSQSTSSAGKQPIQSPAQDGLVSIVAATNVVEVLKGPAKDEPADNLPQLIQKVRGIIDQPNKELFENPFSRFFILVPGQYEGKDRNLLWFLCKTPRTKDYKAPERHLIHINRSGTLRGLVEEEGFLDRYAVYMLGLVCYLIEDLSEGGKADDPILEQASEFVVLLEKAREILLKAMMAKKLTAAAPPITIPLSPTPTSASTSSFASTTTIQSATKEKKGLKGIFSKRLSIRSTSSSSSSPSSPLASSSIASSTNVSTSPASNKVRAEDIVLSEKDRQELFKIAADSICPLEGRALRDVASYIDGIDPFNPLELPFCDLYRVTTGWSSVEWLCEQHHFEYRGPAMVNKDYTDPYEILQRWNLGYLGRYTPILSKLTLFLRNAMFLSEESLGPILTPNPSTKPVEGDTKKAAVVVEELRIRMPARHWYSGETLKELVQLIEKSSIRYLTLTFQDVEKVDPNPLALRQNNEGNRYDALAGLFTNPKLISIEISGVEMFGLQTNNWAFPPGSCKSLRSFKYGSVILPSDQTVLTTLFNQAFPRTLVELRLGQPIVSRISTPLANAIAQFRHLEVLHLHSIENVLNYGPLPNLTNLTSASVGGPYTPKSALRELDIVIAPFERGQFEQFIRPVAHQLETLVVMQNGFVPNQLDMLASTPPSGLESDLVLFPFLTKLHIPLPGSTPRNVKLTSLVLAQVTNQLLYLGLFYERRQSSKEMSTVLSVVAKAGAKRLHRLYLQGFHAKDINPLWSIFPANGGVSPIHTLALEDICDPATILPAQLVRVELRQLWLGWLESDEDGEPLYEDWLTQLLQTLNFNSLLTLSIMKCSFSQRSFDILWDARLNEFQPALKINLGYYASQDWKPCPENPDDLLILDLVRKHGGDRFYGGGLFGHNLNGANPVFLRRELLGY